MSIPPVTIERTAISLPAKLLKKGRQIARSRERNFSSYIADLIMQDANRVEADALIATLNKTK